MSLYSQYIKERENGEILEYPHGFATYFIKNGECYIRDIYVEPAYRYNNLATTIVDEITKIAKSKNCRVIIGSVCPTANKSEDSKKAIASYGMKYFRTIGDLEYYFKEIK